MTTDTTKTTPAATIEPRWVNVGATAPTSRSWGRADAATTTRDEPDYDWLKVAELTGTATDTDADLADDADPDAAVEPGEVAPLHIDSPTARVRSGWGGRRARG